MSTTVSSIIVATDFSPQSDRAVTRAAQLAAEHGAALEIVHAAPMPMPMPVWGDMAGGTWIENSELVAAGESRLARQRDDLASQFPITIGVHCEAAPPVGLVNARSEALGADLVVIGATGEGAIAQRLFGSTAQSLVRQARRPLLVVRTDAAQRYRHLLASTDFSDDAAQAARRARQLAPTAEISLFSALEQPRLRGDWFNSLDEATRQANLQKARDEAMLRMQPLATALGDPHARKYVRDGRASHELMQVLAECGADLLSVGAHGKSRLEAGLLGSTSLHAVAEAPCDVLVVPHIA
jgi:nucleotide-binding universal stress UspA family protein